MRIPLKKREFDLQHNLPSGGSLTLNIPAQVRDIVSSCIEFKKLARNSKSDLEFLDHLDGIIARWSQRDAVYRKNPALATTSSALRLMKEWVKRVVSVADLDADATDESRQKTIELVLLQQRCAVSEWLKHENNNSSAFEDIRKEFQKAADAGQGIEAARLALVRAVAYLCCRNTKEAVNVTRGECCCCGSCITLACLFCCNCFDVILCCVVFFESVALISSDTFFPHRPKFARPLCVAKSSRARPPSG
jgi:hypothetical protein